ncbi:MAG TPA: hypothetical protein VF401_00525 [Candidatus Saccharimonadales bacterium]
MSNSLVFRPFTRVYKRGVSELLYAVVLLMLGAGFFLLFSYDAPWWTFLLVCLGFGAATLPFTWRPKPDNKDWNSRTAREVACYQGLLAVSLVLLIVFSAPWWFAVGALLFYAGTVTLCWCVIWPEHFKDEVIVSLVFGLMYAIQAVGLSAYRFLQLMQNPYKLWKMAPELRARPDLLTNTGAYHADQDAHREWELRAKGNHFVIREYHTSPLSRLVSWLSRSGAIIEIKFDEGHGLNVQQYRYFRRKTNDYLGLARRDWNAGGSSGEGAEKRYVKVSFDLRRGYHHLTEIDARLLAECIKDARKFRGDRRSGDRSIDID